MNLWSAIETIGPNGDVPASWRIHLGDNFDLVKAAFLQSLPDTLAASVPCPRDCGCRHRVVLADAALTPLSVSALFDTRPPHCSTRREEALSNFGAGVRSCKLMAVCQCQEWCCDDFELQPADIVPWKLSWPKLGRALVKALDLDAKAVPLGLPQTAQLGSWSSDAVPVILTAQPGSSALRSVIADLVARLQRPFILLTPTRQFVTAPCLELLGRAHADLFSLDRTVELASTAALRPRRAPGELFARFTPEPETIEADTVQRAFAIVRRFDAESPCREPSLLRVFRLYCVEEMTVDRMARQVGCNRMTILRRLKQLETVTGVNPLNLRRVSVHLDKLTDHTTDSRAARIHPRRLIHDSEGGEHS